MQAVEALSKHVTLWAFTRAVDLVPCFPQIDRDDGSVVAVPIWVDSAGKSVVVFDMRAVTGPVYASIITGKLTYADCAAEARRHGLADWCAFAFGHDQPLQAVSAIPVVSGGVIQFRTLHEEPIWYGTLAARLGSRAFWPTPENVAVCRDHQPLLILHHESCTLYPDEAGHRHHDRAFFADLVDRDVGSVLIVPPRPPALADVSLHGVDCRGVLAVAPVPPRAGREGVAVFLDARHAGERPRMWYAGCKYLDPCALVNLLGLRPPPLFHVVIGPVRQCQGLIEARDGDVICFGYRLGQLSSSAALLVATIGDTEDAEPPCGQPPEDPFGPSLPESCGYGKEDKETPCERLPGSDSFKSCYVGEGFSFPPFPFGCHYGLGASSFLDFISKDFCIYLQLQDHVSALPCREGGALHNKLLGQWNRDCKLLTEPVSYNRSDEGRLEALRFCAHALGEDWFFIDPWDLREYHLLPLPPSVSLPLAAPTEVACALLSPEYCHEHITATVNLPAELDDLYQALQVARCPDKARRSPFFIEVNPQPESAWGALIVVPLWARFERVICLDLRSIDGRLFACNAPVTADRFAILFLTDLPLHTECDIYVGGMQFPLQDGAQVYLNQGDLVTLVPLGSEAPAYYDLEDMLQTPLTWDEGPAFPMPRGRSMYCLCTPGQHRLFELQEGRGLYYRHDVAAFLGLADEGLILAPAQPRPADVAMFGFPCRTVVAVDSSSIPTFPTMSLAMVDCRPIHQGWLCLTFTAEGVPYQELLDDFNAFAPPGLAASLYGGLVVDGILVLRHGQVLEVLYVPVEEEAQVASPAVGSDNEDSDLEDDDFAGSTAHSSTGSGGFPIPEAEEYSGTAPAESPQWQRTSGAAFLLSCIVLGTIVALAPDHVCLAAATLAMQRIRSHNGGALAGLALLCSVQVLGVAGMHFSINGPTTRERVPLASGEPVTISLSAMLPPKAELRVPVCGGLHTDLSLRAVATPSKQVWGRDVSRSAGLLPEGCPVQVSGGGFLANLVVDEDLQTLLEESVHNMQGYPLFLACTLLETLVEHFHEDPPQAPAARRFVPLAELCPRVWPGDNYYKSRSSEEATTFDRTMPLSFGSVSIGFNTEQLHALFKPTFACLSLAECAQVLPNPLRKQFIAYAASADPSLPVGPVCFVDGSFCTETPGEPVAMGWSCVFVDAAEGMCGVLAAQMPQWAMDLVEVPSAFRAECCALIVGYWIGLSVWNEKGFSILSDCQSAIDIAQGLSAIRTAGIAQVLGHVAGCCQSLAGGNISLRHVAGHSGLVGNELADLCAKSAAKGRDLGTLAWDVDGGPDWWQGGGYLWSWCGVVCRWAMGDDALPPPLGSDLSTGRDLHADVHPDVLQPFLPDPARCLNADQLFSAQLCLRMASYNALSLAGESTGQKDESLAFRPARPAMLASQLEAHGVHCAAIQEARTQEGFLYTGSFLRYCSGGQKGHLGVELWFRRDHRLVCHSAISDAEPVTFVKPAFVVLFQDPRRLVVLFKQANLQIIFASIHAPHRGYDEATIRHWWRETELILHRESRGRLLIIGGDCNAALGSVESDNVSHAEEEQEDFAGSCLHELLHKCCIWAPATWTRCQQGPGWTYVQRRNGATSRPDFVLLPQSWQMGSVVAWTEPAITAANMVIDHVATLVDVHVQLRCGAGNTREVAQRIDVSALVHPDNRATLEGILAKAPRPSWEVSAHTHTAQVAGYLQTALATAFPRPRSRPLHPFLSETAWDLQHQVARLRRKCAHIKQVIRRQTLLAVFGAWQGERRDVASPDSAWLRDAQFAEALYGFRLGCFAKALRNRCKADRASYMSDLADQVQNAPEAAYKAVSKLLCRRRKQPFAPAVLPSVLEADGSLCQTPEDTRRRWRQHFSALEAGEDRTPEELIKQLTSKGERSWPSPASLASIPTPLDVQSAASAAQRGKACGPDQIPGELGIICPQGLQQVLYPLALKLGLLGEEGVGFKSGVLTWLYKGRGAHNECSAFRGIMLLSNLGKVLHRTFRPAIQQHYAQHAPVLQISGRKGGSVVFGSHLARTYMRWKWRSGQACAIVFADVASAYYATRRELAARHPEDELANEDSSVSPAEEDSLEGQLARPSALAQQSAEPWLRALTTVLNEDTWMRLQGDDVPVATFQGTRPGSAWADLTFGVLVARILHLKRKLKGEDGYEASGLPVAWDGCRNWSPRSPDSHTAYITDLVWADDVSSPVAVDDVHALAKAVGVEVGALADAFASHGFSLSYGPLKTAAIMCPRGAGARAVRRHLFGRDATIAVMREASGVVHLPIVETYKHLGVLQMPAGNIHAEIKQRCALAWAAFREGRTKVFRCRRVSLQRRGTLLSTLVLSKLVFGAGAWPPLGAIDTRLFGGAVTSLYRATLNVAHQADQHLSTATICALLGLPDAYTLLVVEQLRYLRQLVAHAPDPLWALLRNDAPYLDALRDALAWLYARVAATTTLPHPLEVWEPWCHLCSNRPGLFKGMVRRAKGLEQCRIQCYAAMQALHKAIRVHSDGELIEPCEAPRIYPEACLVCRKAFETRGAWACHASKLHGYRLAATVLAGSHGDTLCRGCGKCYANTGRLRRHLLHSAVCRAQWGAFTMAEGVVIPALHERQPPLHIEGVLERMHEGYDPASYSKGLLEALCRLRSPSAQQVWDLVVDFVEPLQVLRQTLDMWRRSEFFCDEWCEIAEDVLLMLDPEVCCDVFSKTPKQSGPTLCCPDLPGPFGTILPFVLTGAMAAFALQTAPCPSFSYPWIGGATLAAAKRQAAFVEASCDVISTLVQQSQTTRVELRVSRNTLASLEPIPTWLLSVGFELVDEGLRSPID